MSVTLTLTRREGTGEATFADGSTSMVISQTTDVVIKGVTESNAPNNIRLTATSGSRTLAFDDFTVVEVSLKEVSFSGTNYNEVHADDGSGPYTAPHWQDNSTPLDGDADDDGDRKLPVSFTANSKMLVSAKWIVKPAAAVGGMTLKASGDGPGSLDIPEIFATLSGEELSISNIEAAVAFANEIDFFDPMQIQWKVLLGSLLVQAGQSNNQVYITLRTPTVTPLYHTLAHLSCKNADGQTVDDQITDRIWDEFTDRDVRRADGTRLHYYASYLTDNVYTHELLARGDGQCGSWAGLFIELLKVQGIENPDEYRTIWTSLRRNGGFLVKNWVYSGSGVSGHPEFPYLNIRDIPLIGDSSYNWRFAEAYDDDGVPGQGTANPASYFNNHQIVYIAGRYYDPSYGRTYASLDEFITEAIDGFYWETPHPVDEPTVDLDLNGDGDKEDLGEVVLTAVLINWDGASLSIQEEIEEY